MKHAKKFASLLLALVMIFALAITAFAAETGTITVDNPIAGQTYTAYKIFDVTYNTDKSAYSYTIDSSNEWFTTVQTYAATEDNGLTLTQVNGSTTYVVTTTAAFSAPSFALALKTAVTGKTGTALTAQADGTVSVSGLELGYYFVTSTNGALCNLTTTNPTVTIHDKNDIPFDKVDDQESVDVGQIVNYTITGKVPDYTGFTEFMYQITDTMSAGLTFNNDVKVYIGGNEVNANITLKTGNDAGTKDFILDIDVMKFTIGAKIEVKYSATVNENAVAKIENNHATLEYSNDPTNANSTATREDKETVYSAKIVIDKYAKNADNANDTSKKLAGATFILYKEVTAAGASEATKMYYKWDDTNKKVVWVADKTDATSKTTDDKGATSFDGLADGTYYLEETAAPAGYNLLDAPVSVTVNGADAKTADNLSSLTVTEKVANSTGTILPSTGGIGTTIFYVVGSILVIGAIVLLVTKKRMSMKG